MMIFEFLWQFFYSYLPFIEILTAILCGLYFYRKIGIWVSKGRK